MKHCILFFSLLFCIVSAHAQTSRGVKDGYNTEKYPEISFVWNEYNPEVKASSQFVLMENGKKLDFKFSCLSKTNIAERPKTILFLWEDMASHSGQYEFSLNLLSHFFDETGSSGDKFNVAVFNRKNDKDISILNLLSNSFTSDKSSLNQRIKNNKRNNSVFNTFPEQSDLYLAIDAALDILKKESNDNIGIIIVITAGRNVKASGASTEMASVQIKALNAGIPIYVVQYPLYGQTPEINTLSKETYGQTVNVPDWQQALTELKNFNKDINARYYGQDYNITFNTSQKRDGKAHNIELSIDKVPHALSFTAPDLSLELWCKENIIWLIGGIILFIVIIIIIVVFIKKAGNKRKQQRQEDHAKIAEAEKKATEATEKTTQEGIRREKEDAERKRNEQAMQQRAEEERLVNLMRTKNLYPRLQCLIGKERKTYTIDKLITTIGRENSNDLVLNLPTVSREHATITFTGGAFEIYNRSKTNKLILNGQFVEHSTLKNADMIGLGEAVITFYL
jgi:hypothetical protein